MRAEGQALFGGTSKPKSPSTSSRSAESSEPDESAGVASKAPPSRHGKTPSASPAAVTDTGWAIALEYLSGPDLNRTAAQRRIALARDLGRDDIAIRKRQDGAVIVLGSYASAADKGAQSDLEWVRAFHRDKTFPFAKAYLLPPQIETSPDSPHSEWDLAGIRSTRERANADLTLQVAVFDGGGNITKARTEAVAFTSRLRESGEDAYYFHGSSLSVVTIGLFSAREADANGNPSSAAARAAKKAHPLNLRNGTTPIPDIRGNPQESALMRIP